MTISIPKKIKPRIYKKTLYIGNLRLFKFTREYSKKFLHKTVWMILLITIMITMVFGSLAMLFGSANNPQQQVITVPTTK